MNSFFYITFIAVLLMHFTSLADSCCSSSCSCGCKKSPPLKLIYQAAANFEEVQACGRKFVSSQSVSKDGVRLINFRAELKKNESPINLCDCVHDFLSQKDWLDGSTKSCCWRKNIATMTVEGEPDPTFDNTITDSPLKQLKDVFDQFKYAELEGLHCRVSGKINKIGKVHCYVQCDLLPNSPSKEPLCKGIMRYLNQKNWLGDVTNTCTSDEKLLDMEIMAKEK